MTTSVRVALFSLLSTVAFTATARADDACATDRTRLCSEATGRHASMQCMRTHEAELSDACKAQRVAVKEARQQVKAECRPDAERLCQGVAPGRGGIRACLRAHATELAPVCRQAIAHAKEVREYIHPGCGPDVKQFCQGVEHGGGRVRACLQSHSTELSASCQAQMQKRAARRPDRAQAADGRTVP